MEDKLDFLLNKANIGIYNKCEIIEIFGYNKDKKEAFNIYTLIIFENTEQKDIEGLMTEKLQNFNKNFSWGIKRRIVDIDTVKKLYSELLKTNKYEIDKLLSIGDLKLLPEQYVPARESMHKKIQLNNILKNNFHNGSYVLEFFDEEKGNVKFLLENSVLLNEFSEVVSNILPIKIGTLSDRLGNIIFQLPINSLELSLDSIIQEEPAKYKGISLEIYPKSKDFNIKNLQVRLFEENDNLVTRQRLIDITKNKLHIDFDDCYGTYVELIDKNSSLLLFKHKFSIVKEFHINGALIEHQKRVFEIGDKKEKLQVSTNANSSVLGKVKEKPFNEWIRERKYEEELKELEKSKSFIQYFGNKEEQALQDIRELINKYGERGVYIWDPYLSAIDIKKTLYYAENTYIPMKAISGLKQNKSKNEAKEEMIKEFEKDEKKFLFLNLEVRGKIGDNGYDFHDRFLIFPLEQPKVWSLGISINQLGKSHHILQEVKNAQHILNAFNKLWNELDDEECLIWKSN